MLTMQSMQIELHHHNSRPTLVQQQLDELHEELQKSRQMHTAACSRADQLEAEQRQLTLLLLPNEQTDRQAPQPGGLQAAATKLAKAAASGTHEVARLQEARSIPWLPQEEQSLPWHILSELPCLRHTSLRA